MTDNVFDKFVTDKLKDHQSPVPPGLWEKIERKKDKDLKGGFWLSRTALWPGLFFLILSLGVGYYFSKDGDQAADAKPVNGETAAAKNGGLAENGNTTANTNGDEGKENSGANNTNNPNNSNTAIIEGSEKKDDGKNVNGNDEHNIAKVSTVTSTTKKQKKAIKATTSNEDGNNNAVVYRSKRNKTVKSKNVSFSGNNLQNGKRKKNLVDELISKASRDTKTLDNSNSDLSVFKPSLAKDKIAYNLRKLNVNSKEGFDLSQIRIFGIDCPTAGTVRRHDWYLEVYGSPDLAMKTVSSNNQAYLQKKDSTESTQIGYTAGFRITKSLTENLLLKAGLQYSQINERFNLRTENERRITTVITIRTITTPSGTDTTIRDTTTVEQIGYSIRRTYNRYKSLDVPIIASYEFGNEKLKFAVNAGVILNLRSWYIGETLNDSLNVVSINSKTSPIYKQNIGLGIYAGFSVMKPISNNFDLFVEPYFRYNLSNMATGAGYSQKFNAAGVSFGIRYKLNRQRR